MPPRLIDGYESGVDEDDMEEAYFDGHVCPLLATVANMTATSKLGDAKIFVYDHHGHYMMHRFEPEVAWDIDVRKLVMFVLATIKIDLILDYEIVERAKVSLLNEKTGRWCDFHMNNDEDVKMKDVGYEEGDFAVIVGVLHESMMPKIATK